MNKLGILGGQYTVIYKTIFYNYLKYKKDKMMKQNLAIKIHLKWLCCLFILIPTLNDSAIADTTWEYVSPNPVPPYRWNDYSKIYFFNQNNGWILAYRNFIYFTGDRGQTWELQTPATACMLFDIFFVDDSTGWVTGDWDCTIMHTNNQGRTWTLQQKGISGVLNNIFFIDPNTGWAVGENNNRAVMMKTSNGGQNWETVDLSIHRALKKIYFIDSLSGWAVGESGLIIHSTDGGLSWQVQESGRTADFLDICFFNSEQGMIIGRDGYLLLTADGGDHWEKSKHSGENYINSCQILGPDKAALLGLNLAMTDDGGQSWQSVNYRTEIPEYIIVDKLCFINNDCWITGDGSSIFYSGDQGQTWSLKSHITLSILQTVAVPDSDKCWVGGIDILLRTDDNGSTWSKPDLNLYEVEDFFFTCPDTGWMLAWPDLNYTEDGGESWQSLINMTYMINEPSPFYKIFFINSRIGWGISSSNLIRTLDGGRTWSDPDEVISTVTDIHLHNLFFINELQGWCAGVNGLIMKTDDGGKTWVQKPSGTDEIINDIFFTDHLNGWAVGNNGSVLKTVDGGETWLSKNLSGPLRGVEFINQMEGWIISWAVYHTLDGGDTWETQMETVGELYDIELFDETHGWIVGNTGIALKLKHISQNTSISYPEVPSLPEQHQILFVTPNPFNSSNRIEVILDQTCSVRLSVLNIRGERIRILLDEMKSSGTYWLQWDGRNASGQQVPSGIYLLNLETPDDREIIKIQMLR